MFQYQFEIPNEHCIPENVIISDNPAEVTSAVCLKNCKICKQFFTTIFEYKTHMKEHRKVCCTFCLIWINFYMCTFF